MRKVSAADLLRVAADAQSGSKAAGENALTGEYFRDVPVNYHIGHEGNIRVAE